jgi:hypothetical protein
VDGANGSLNGRRVRKVNNPIAKFYQWQVASGALDGWTSYHLAAGLFIAKVAQWLGASDFWAVMWVAIIGVAWEIFEVYVEGMEETYGTRKKWAWNTATDLFVEIAAAWWMVLPSHYIPFFAWLNPANAF